MDRPKRLAAVYRRFADELEHMPDSEPYLVAVMAKYNAQAINALRAPTSPRPDAIVRNTPETLDETIVRDMMPARYRRAEGETE